FYNRHMELDLSYLEIFASHFTATVPLAYVFVPHIASSFGMKNAIAVMLLGQFIGIIKFLLQVRYAYTEYKQEISGEPLRSRPSIFGKIVKQLYIVLSNINRAVLPILYFCVAFLLIQHGLSAIFYNAILSVALFTICAVLYVLCLLGSFVFPNTIFIYYLVTFASLAASAISAAGDVYAGIPVPTNTYMRPILSMLATVFIFTSLELPKSLLQSTKNIYANSKIIAMAVASILAQVCAMCFAFMNRNTMPHLISLFSSDLLSYTEVLYNKTVSFIPVAMGIASLSPIFSIYRNAHSNYLSVFSIPSYVETLIFVVFAFIPLISMVFLYFTSVSMWAMIAVLVLHFINLFLVWPVKNIFTHLSNRYGRLNMLSLCIIVLICIILGIGINENAIYLDSQIERTPMCNAIPAPH
ncbi:hypothetical protein ENBRE01_3014, partial [Enteropsectra breve]